MLKDLAIILAISVFVAVLYGGVTRTYFCGYDDFIEIHRAAFEETRQPQRILTGTHLGTYKYRPFSHGINFLTYKLSGGDPPLFRVRNLMAHLINVGLVYAIGLMLFSNRLTSAVAALLFGAHPLVNQPVVAASFTITLAHTAFLFSFFCFLFSVRRKRGSLIWLSFALVSGWLGTLNYEASISVFPLMFAYLLIHFVFWRQRLINSRFLVVMTLGTILLIGSYFGLRLLFVSMGAQRAIPNVNTMLKAGLMYFGALISPIDSIMASEWFGAPLPSELRMDSISSEIRVFLMVGLFVVLVALIFLVRPIVNRLREAQWADLVFLLLAVFFTLLPFVLLTPKPSETYVYMAVAFAALLFAATLQALIVSGSTKGRLIYITVIGVLALSFSLGTWVRNNRVVRCGETVTRILPALQNEKWKAGAWSIWLSPVPGEPRSRRYGIYGWRGIDTIADPGVEVAVQWVNNNEMLRARVVEPEYFKSDCNGTQDVCLWVHEDGTVEPWREPPNK